MRTIYKQIWTHKSGKIGAGTYGALHKRPLHKGPHQNQAIAQKLGILGEKVTSMTGLRIEKYLLGPI